MEAPVTRTSSECLVFNCVSYILTAHGISESENEEYKDTNPECDSGSDSEMEPPKDPKKKKD